MANSKEFSHITVTADDDDDVVIQAGVVEEPAAEEPVEEAPLEEPVDEPGAEEADDAVAEAVEEAAVEKEGAGETADAASYHETTWKRPRCPRPRRSSSSWPCWALSPLRPGTFWPTSPVGLREARGTASTW